MSERSIAGDDGAVAATTVALSLTNQARRFAAWVGARVAIGEIRQVGAKRFAPHSGRVGTVVRTHFAGVYVQLDPTPRERTTKTVLVLLELSNATSRTEDCVLTRRS